MNKYILFFAILFYGISSVSVQANAANPPVPDPFQRFDADSSLTIDYTDLNSLLGSVVLDTGRSTRKKTGPTHAQTGTRMKVHVNRATVNEGNRFYLKYLMITRKTSKYFVIFETDSKNYPLQHHSKITLVMSNWPIG
jgi:hypothetical protein